MVYQWPGVAGLERAAAKCTARDEQEIENDVRDEYVKSFELLHKNKVIKDKSLLSIPRFFFKPPASTTNADSLNEQVRREARIRLLKKNEKLLLESTDLDLLWFALLKKISTPKDGSERINYDDFCQVMETLPAKVRPYFNASLFLKFRHDEYGRISITAFFQYVVRMDALKNKRLSLSYYDSGGLGFMLEQDLESFIADQMTVFPSLMALDESFSQFYLCSAVRKIFFTLDPKKKGKIRVRDLVTSDVLNQFLMLRHEQMSPEELASNWFSAQNAIRIYSTYIRLDLDKNGLLSKEELKGYGAGGMTSVFIDRLFAECQTYDQEMDYKAFVEFVLAMENKNTIQSLYFMWRMVDVEKKGFLTIFDINYFFRAVSKQLELNGTPVGVEDVKDEIFDMVHPEDPLKITFNDLVKSGIGSTVLDMLTDVVAFFEYDNRENAMASHEPEDDDQ